MNRARYDKCKCVVGRAATPDSAAKEQGSCWKASRNCSSSASCKFQSKGADQLRSSVKEREGFGQRQKRVLESAGKDVEQLGRPLRMKGVEARSGRSGGSVTGVRRDSVVLCWAYRILQARRGGKPACTT